MKRYLLLVVFCVLISAAYPQLGFIQTSFQWSEAYALLALPDGSVIAGSNNGHIYKTTDLGTTWPMVFSSTYSPIRCFTYSPVTSYLYAGAGFDNPGGVLRSTNMGNSWTTLSGTIMSKAVYALVVADDGSIIAGCKNRDTTTGTLFRSTDSGSSWQIVHNLYDWECFDLAKSLTGTLYASAGTSSNGAVLRSFNNGAEWTNIGPNSDYQRTGVITYSVNDSLYYYNSGRFYKRHANGNWIQMPNIDSGNSIDRGLCVTNDNVLFLAGNGLFSSTNGGVTWVPIIEGSVFYSIALDVFGYLWLGGDGQVLRSTYPLIPPGVPALVTPISGALYQLLTPTMSWQSVTGAAHYQIQVSTSNGFSNPAIDDTTSTTSYTNDDIVLSTDTIYYWRVRGYNLNGYSDWSEIRSFRTFNPNAPTNLAGSSEPGIVHLAWTPPVSPVVSALGYNIYRRTGPSGPFAQLNVEALSAQTVTYNDSISTPDTYSYGVKAIYPPSVESALSNIVSVDATVQISALSVTPAGGIYNQEQSVTLVCPTANAFIYYTMDGSDPVESVSNLYVAPLPITTTTTLKAMAFKALWLPSPLLEETYILLNPPQNVNASQSQSSVLLTWQIPRITTRVLLGYNVYRRFGETGNFIHLNPSVLVTDTQYLDSSIVCGTYYYYVTAVYSDGASDPSETVSITTSLAVSAPEFTPPPGTYAIPQYVRITTATEQDTIYYTRDGSEPSPSSSIYTGIPLIVEVSDTITARAFKYGWLPSEIVVGDYIISPVSVDDHTAGPLQTSLQAAYPNPCRGFSTIKYTVSQEADVTVSVYNIKGQLVRSLVRGSCKSGIYETVWDCKDRHGLPAADGIYVVSLDDGKNRCFLKLMISK